MKKTILLFLQILTISTFLLGSAFTPVRQESDPEVRITQIDTSEFPYVTFYVSFSDANGEPVPVDPSRLTIFENGKAIPPDQIEGYGDVGPLTTILVMDISSSMNNVGKMDSAKAAASEYVAQLRPSDQAGLLAFNSSIEVVQEITSDQNSLTRAIESLSTGRETAMYDALISAVDHLESASGRMAIIVLTDGMDNASAATANDVIERIGPAGFTISTIGLGISKEILDASEGIDEEALISLAEQAGGVYGYAEDKESLTRLYQTYATSMQSEYAITYLSPATLRDGVNRSLEVSLHTASGPPGAANQETYNPGGLVPEVIEPVSWPIFFTLLAGLITLLFLPSLLTWMRSSFWKPFKKSGRIKLSPSRKPRIKLKN